MKRLQPAQPLPAYAPLNNSWLSHLCRDAPRHQHRQLFDETRALAISQILEAIQSAKGLTTTTLSEILNSISSESETNRDLLWRWKRRGAIRYYNERPCFHSSVALTIGRHLHHGKKNWCPSIPALEPLFWIWVEFPDSPTRVMGAYPFVHDAIYLCSVIDASGSLPTSIPTPQAPYAVASSNFTTPGWYRMPAGALLYSTYTGLAYTSDGTPDPNWLSVSGGVIRFWHNQEVTLPDLYHWQPQIRQLDLLDEALIPDILQTARILSLQLLAYERLRHERGFSLL